MALRYDQAQFEASYGRAADIPEASMPEVSFAGRSNVGKSSLLNKLVGRKALAKVSSTPGRTANINFFEVDGIYLVDCPKAKQVKAEGIYPYCHFVTEQELMKGLYDGSISYYERLNYDYPYEVYQSR